jgi:hypothetical protein
LIERDNDSKLIDCVSETNKTPPASREPVEN